MSARGDRRPILGNAFASGSNGRRSGAFRQSGRSECLLPALCMDRLRLAVAPRLSWPTIWTSSCRNHGNRGVECLRHSVLLGAPSQHSICWWGQEHGRTIPLAVIGVIGTFCLPASNVRRCTMMHWRWRADHSRTTKFTNRPGTAISLTISLPASSSFTRRSAFIRASSVSAAISASATILCRVRPFS
jgi:hypothetical protein